jgi:hypothetical protein
MCQNMMAHLSLAIVVGAERIGLYQVQRVKASRSEMSGLSIQVHAMYVWP